MKQKETIYGITELNEHGRVVVRLLGAAKLLPGTYVEIKPTDDAPTAIKPIPYRITPEGRAMVAA